MGAAAKQSKHCLWLQGSGLLNASLSSSMTRRGGARAGAGRKPKKIEPNTDAKQRTLWDKPAGQQHSNHIGGGAIAAGPGRAAAHASLVLRK